MARPVEKRTVRTYRRDVEHLSRLRTAIRMDTDLGKKLATKAVTEIDTLTDTLLAIIKESEPG